MIKDLRIIANRDIENMLIIDNCVGGFANQLKNGIPILPFVGDQKDQELLLLKEYILNLAKKEGSISENNSRSFKLNRLRYFTDPNEYVRFARSSESDL